MAQIAEAHPCPDSRSRRAALRRAAVGAADFWSIAIRAALPRSVNSRVSIPAQRAFCGVHLREGKVNHKKLNPFLGKDSRGRLPQLFGGGRFETAKFRHRFADDRSVEGGEFVRQVVVYHPVAEIPQGNPGCQAADEPDFLHAK